RGSRADDVDGGRIGSRAGHTFGKSAQVAISPAATAARGSVAVADTAEMSRPGGAGLLKANCDLLEHAGRRLAVHRAEVALIEPINNRQANAQYKDTAH